MNRYVHFAWVLTVIIKSESSVYESNSLIVKKKLRSTGVDNHP